MKAFTIVMAIMLGLDLIGRATAIPKGRAPDRDFTVYLIEGLLHVVLFAVAIALLVAD